MLVCIKKTTIRFFNMMFCFFLMFKWDIQPPHKRLAFCLVCGECLGKDRPEFSKEHKEKFLTHKNFIVIPMIDPLLLDDPDAWFRRMNFNRPKILFR